MYCEILNMMFQGAALLRLVLFELAMAMVLMMRTISCAL
jgi:hypothetical protein